MITRSEQDTRELRTFTRYLIELAAHKQLEKTVGRKLPMDTATVPRKWWDPRDELPKPPLSD